MIGSLLFVVHPGKFESFSSIDPRTDLAAGHPIPIDGIDVGRPVPTGLFLSAKVSASTSRVAQFQMGHTVT